MESRERWAAVAAIGVAIGTYALARRRRRPALQSDKAELKAELKKAEAELKATDLATESEKIVADLKRYQPTTVEGMSPELHYLAPHISKIRWTALGDLVAAREKNVTRNIDGSRWISLRLDGCGFSKAVRMLRKKGILEQGFSDTFAEAMQSTLRALMEHFHGCLGYTQSDEITLFIPPTNVVRGERQVHARNGRVMKTASLAAGFATANFVTQLSVRCQEKGVELDGLVQVRPHFDCRVADYASWEEARALLIWRAYDCSVNGVSDAVYQIPGSGKHIQSLGKREKIEWLWKEGRLPLPRHQAYGTTLVRTKRLISGLNPKTGERVETLRGVIEQLDGPVLELVRTDAFLEDIPSSHER